LQYVFQHQVKIISFPTI